MRLPALRLPVVIGVVILIVGYLTLIAGVQSTVTSEQATIGACATEIRAARDTVAHASEDEALANALLRELNGTKKPANETQMVANVWNEAQDVASREGVTLMDIHHDKAQSMSVSAPPASYVDVASGCLGTTSVAASPQTKPQSKAGSIDLQVLPVTVELRGSYMSDIKAIAAFASVPTLLRYEKSDWNALPDGSVSATVTFLGYPPLTMDQIGAPVEQFQTYAGATDGTTPTPSPSPLPMSSGMPQ